MNSAWENAMRGLSDLELTLIMVGAKQGTLKAVGAPENALGAGLTAAKEMVRRERERSASTILGEGW